MKCVKESFINVHNVKKLFTAVGNVRNWIGRDDIFCFVIDYDDIVLV